MTKKDNNNTKKNSLAFDIGEWLGLSSSGREIPAPVLCGESPVPCGTLTGTCCRVLLSAIQWSDWCSPRHAPVPATSTPDLPSKFTTGVAGAQPFSNHNFHCLHWVSKIPFMHPERVPYFKGWFAFPAHRTFPKHHHPGLTQHLFYITSFHNKGPTWLQPQGW